jgi:hypothetical protein
LSVTARWVNRDASTMIAAVYAVFAQNTGAPRTASMAQKLKNYQPDRQNRFAPVHYGDPSVTS